MTLPQDALSAAEADCAAAIKADPKLGLARAGLAVTYAVRGKFAEARREAEAARKDRFVPLAVLAEAFAARKMKDAAGARAILQDAVDERPGFLHALGYLAEDRMEAGDDEQALVLFERYLSRSPGHPWAMGKKARELSKLGRKEEGIKLSEKALALDPQDPELLIETASRYLDAGQDAKAEPLLKKAASAEPPRPLANLRLGFLYLHEQKLKEARAALEACIAQARREDEARTRGVAHADLALVGGKENKYDEALAELGKARAEGNNHLPCQEPEIKRWMDKPALAKICQAAAMAMAHEKLDDDYPTEL
jgi:tetratricopeptide (TPR) repeat protein